MVKVIRGLFNYIVALAVVVASVAAYAALQPQVAASIAQGGSSTTARNQTVITTRGTVDMGNVIASITSTGSIVAAQTANLTFDTTGIIRQVLVKEGQHVDAGQTLAIVDDSSQQAAVVQAQLNLNAAQSALDKIMQPVDPNTIAQAKASVTSAEASYTSKASSVSAADVKIAQDKVQQAQTNQDFANKAAMAAGRFGTNDPNYAMAQAQAGQASFTLAQAQLSLQQTQGGSSLLSAQASIASSQAKLAQTLAGPAQSSIDQAQASVVSAQNQLDQAQHALTKTILVAPYAGVVNQVTAKVGEPAQGTAMVLTDLTTLYANINVDESDISKVAPGQTIIFTIDALPNVTITGKVDRIYPIADATASVITYPVHVVLDKSTAAVRAGMTVNATVDVQEADNVLRVPNNFLRVTAATGQVTVNVVNADGTTVTAVPLKVGLAGADYTEIISGINLGDTVALAAAAKAQ